MAGELCTWTLLLLVVGGTQGAKILGLFPFPAKSHMISFSPLLQELAHRGHEVTVVSSFPLKNPPPNFKDIVLDDLFPKQDIDKMFSLQDQKSFYSILMFIAMGGSAICEQNLRQPNIQKLLADKDLHYDVIIFESFFSECFFGVVHKMNAPVILISANTVTLWLGDPAGNPHTTSYIPDSIAAHRTDMTFKERLINSLNAVLYVGLRELVILPRQDAAMRRVLDDPTIPSVADIERNTSLMLLNTHFSMTFPRPFTPNTIDVGGMHIKPPQKLPKELKKFLDEAPHGVIYFSLGSNVRSANMPESMRLGLLEAFSGLKEQVLWKWETDTLPGKPANVRTEKWLPQNDILAHPNVRVFMTHGGLLSVQEATYFGIPLLAIPVMGDQRPNAARAQDAGYALFLDPWNVTRESVSWALGELLTKPSYRENAKRISALFKDRPQSPLETAVHWTEYVIRHKGARHLRSAATDLYLFQYFLLDVLGVLLAGLGCVVFAVWYVCKALFSRKSTKTSRAKKTN
ncbi:UDP-glycosyltransferase UGT5 [Anabrus simplex]|uniref:UDP-glycosyltransferase UGT5 n=1 Tax=Anabrus simplex TaxID=316456 RepID=UPI0035A2B39C